MKKIVFLAVAMLLAFGVRAQQNNYLKSLVKMTIELRKAKGSSSTCEKMVETLTGVGAPKITLMDDVGTHSAEYKGKGDVKYHLNGVVQKAYDTNHGVNKSRGHYYDSHELGIHYSLIEKSVKGRQTAKYTLTKHSGQQEIVVIPFNTKAEYSAKVYYAGKECERSVDAKNGYTSFVVNNANKSQKIEIVIENQNSSAQAFAIINYNEQRDDK